MSPEPENAADLLQRIAETDAIIAAARVDTPDPEAREMLAEAHRDRALALRRLARHAESVEDWDQFLAIWAVVDPDTIGNYDRVAAEALDFKANSLRVIGRAAEAERTDVELIARFGDDDDARIMPRVDLALGRRAELLLGRRGGTAEALAVVDRLSERFATVPDEELADLAELLVMLSRVLMGVFPAGVLSYLGGPAEIALNLGAETASTLTGAIDARLPLPVLGELTTALGHHTPGMLIRHRRRMAQAQDVAELVRARLAGSADPDLEAIGRRAKLMAGMARLFLGQPSAGLREFSDYEAGNDPVAVAMFTRLAVLNSRQSGWAHQVGTAGFLSLRARALVGDDPKLTRIAYDDSIAEYLPDKLSPYVRLMVRLMRPSQR